MKSVLELTLDSDFDSLIHDLDDTMLIKDIESAVVECPDVIACSLIEEIGERRLEPVSHIFASLLLEDECDELVSVYLLHAIYDLRRYSTIEEYRISCKDKEGIAFLVCMVFSSIINGITSDNISFICNRIKESISSDDYYPLANVLSVLNCVDEEVSKTLLDSLEELAFNSPEEWGVRKDMLEFIQIYKRNLG